MSRVVKGKSDRDVSLMTNARETAFSGEFAEVKEFYSELRRILYQRCAKRFPAFNAAVITAQDCATADSWSSVDPRGRNDWFWKMEYPGYQKIFKRFDIAFKQNSKLVCLSYGVPTASKTGLKVNLIESTPITADRAGAKGFELIAYAAQVYAALLGADEIRIMRPTSERTRSYYCSYGFEYVGNENKPSLPDYCVMRLR